MRPFVGRLNAITRLISVLLPEPLGPMIAVMRPRGMPPTPIAVPGKASLLAAVRPEPTKALYFVARGDGSSEFSETLADHNRAVNRFQRKGSP